MPAVAGQNIHAHKRVFDELHGSCQRIPGISCLVGFIKNVGELGSWREPGQGRRVDSVFNTLFGGLFEPCVWQAVRFLGRSYHFVERRKFSWHP